jgi:REP element-mobilizing transposase RayT
MGYIKIYVHFVWTTKNREPLLKKEIRETIFSHIRENARSKGIFIDFIGGYLDHVHCLISLNTDQRISETIQLIKGESSYWINNQKLTKYKFEWQREYYGISVNLRGVHRVREYISKQEAHHSKIPFQAEYEEFKKYIGF